jgi:hypothetical protein
MSLGKVENWVKGNNRWNIHIWFEITAPKSLGWNQTEKTGQILNLNRLFDLFYHFVTWESILYLIILFSCFLFYFPRQNATERNRTEQNETERDRTEQNGTERKRTEQNGTERNRTEQNGTERNRTDQNWTERIRTEQNGTERNRMEQKEQNGT